jgi:ketosteroid isomerase-like protein
MYHAIVAHRTRSIFAAISKGDAQPMLRSLAKQFVYRFEGDTSIGGERRTLASMELWWSRLFRLFPGFRFEVIDVIVKGWPWNTRLATYLTFQAALPDGSPYENVVVQIISMRWGKITRIHTLEDSLRCARTLETLASRGQTEAVAPAIIDLAA